MKYRKKPVVIDAEQFLCQPLSEDAHCPIGVCLKKCGMVKGPHIHTMEGPLHVSQGDWIITGVQGERYPCKPDIFEQTYEKVEGDS